MSPEGKSPREANVPRRQMSPGGKSPREANVPGIQMSPGGKEDWDAKVSFSQRRQKRLGGKSLWDAKVPFFCGRQMSPGGKVARRQKVRRQIRWEANKTREANLPDAKVPWPSKNIALVACSFHGLI